ncbi:hypothetical protein [Dehalobacter sp.]|uniref:Uncharacterized protein n=1 Tax=Dehalobacter restrictus (strain DSM 9455 / PER-K23) TaxID=871738 RepID=A0ABN4BUZ0_DEHRP|nr:hypothetical protein [Dehalobacter sp.]AHF11218.1 hypothetical protein DEHRE_01680 [Dehalobacter restrictus DSM 9455]MDJ0306097.1 hypothetical protein [Dehalobacter sp.]
MKEVYKLLGFIRGAEMEELISNIVSISEPSSEIPSKKRYIRT